LPDFCFINNSEATDYSEAKFFFTPKNKTRSLRAKSVCRGNRSEGQYKVNMPIHLRLLDVCGSLREIEENKN